MVRNTLKNSGRIVLIIFLHLILFPACVSEYESYIPSVKVDFTINLGADPGNHLNTVGSTLFFPGQGYAGVIVAYAGDGLYYAFDAACSNEKNRTSVVKPDDLVGQKGSGTGKCTQCGSKFNLFGGGYTISGPATRNLQPYKVSVGGGRLRVYN